MGDLGQRLKQEREARGVSLQEIARQTRIGVRLLQAIEAEEFDQLPGGIFNKSFIQQYAQYLSLDEKQAVRDYLRATASTREAAFPQPSPPGRSISDISPSVIKLALGAAAIAFIALMAWLVSPRSEKSAESEVAAVSTSPSASSRMVPSSREPVPAYQFATPQPSTAGIAAADNDRVASRAATESLPAEVLPRPEAGAAPTPAELLREAADHERLEGELPEELLLQINARSTVWISITADGEQTWQGTMQANQSREVQAVETIRLTVGNAGGVELTLNGKDLGSLGGEGEVKTVTLAARALQEVVP